MSKVKEKSTSQLNLKNLGGLTILSIAMKIAGTSMGVYISNIVGSSVLGGYQIIMSVYGFAINLAISGLGFTATRLVAEKLAQGKIHTSKQASKSIITYSFLFGIIACTGLIAFSDYIITNVLHFNIDKIAIYILSLSLPFVSMSSAFHGYLLGAKKAGVSYFVQFIEQIARIILLYFLSSIFLPGGKNRAILMLCVSTTIAEIISCITAFNLFLKQSRKITYEICKDIPLHIDREIFKISFPVAITTYIRSGLNTLKQILIPKSLKKTGLSYTSSLAVYGTICGKVLPITSFPLVVVQCIATVIIPEFSELNVTHRQDRIKEKLESIIKKVLVFGILIFGYFMVMSEELGFILYNDETVRKIFKIALSACCFNVYR